MLREIATCPEMVDEGHERLELDERRDEKDGDLTGGKSNARYSTSSAAPRRVGCLRDKVTVVEREDDGNVACSAGRGVSESRHRSRGRKRMGHEPSI